MSSAPLADPRQRPADRADVGASGFARGGDRGRRAGNADQRAGRRRRDLLARRRTSVRCWWQLAGHAHPVGGNHDRGRYFRWFRGGAALLVASTANEAAGQAVRISVATDGTLANDIEPGPVALSATGRFVAFLSFASNLVPGDTNGVADIFLRDRDTDADGVFDEPGAVSTIRVSQAGAGAGQRPELPSRRHAGRTLRLLRVGGHELLQRGQPPLPFTEILRWDRLSGAIVLVSRNDAGEPLNARSFWPAPTDDGNVVYFITSANNGPARGRRRRARSAATSPPASRPPWPSARTARSIGRVCPATAASSPTASCRRVPPAAHRRPGRGGAGSRLRRRVRAGVARRRVPPGILYTGDSGGPAFRVHLRSGERRQVGETNLFSLGAASGASPSGRYVQGSTAFFGDFVYGSWTASFFPHGVVAFDGLDRWLILIQHRLVAAAAVRGAVRDSGRRPSSTTTKTASMTTGSCSSA